MRKLEQRCEETRIPLSRYVRDLISSDLLDDPKAVPFVDEPLKPLSCLCKELIPTRAEDLEKLIEGGSEPKIAMRLIDSFVDALEKCPENKKAVLKSLEKANVISVKINTCE
jgi:hypothetical protein